MSDTVARVVHRDEPHFLRAADGTAITVIRVRGDAESSKGPALLIHGAGMRAESFRPPIPRTIVDALIDDGWDVWMLNWRGSTDLDPLPWTLDDVARYDIPAAVRHIVDETGAATVKAFAHCAGSAALSMAAVAGLVPEVDVIVANGVSLHPVTPRFGRVKLHVLRPALQQREPYVDIAWGDGPEKGIAWVTRTAVRVWHAECGNATCNMASFALGSGHPALLQHANIDEATHTWIANEFGKVPMSFYAQLAASDRAHQLVAVRPGDDLPRRYASAPPKTQARFALLAGELNRAFLPRGQKATFDYLERHQPGRHSFHLIPRYSHADVFLGRRAHAEVFPRILSEFNR